MKPKSLDGMDVQPTPSDLQCPANVRQFHRKIERVKITDPKGGVGDFHESG